MKNTKRNYCMTLFFALFLINHKSYAQIILWGIDITKSHPEITGSKAVRLEKNPYADFVTIGTWGGKETIAYRFDVDNYGKASKTHSLQQQDPSKYDDELVTLLKTKFGEPIKIFKLDKFMSPSTEAHAHAWLVKYNKQYLTVWMRPGGINTGFFLFIKLYESKEKANDDHWMLLRDDEVCPDC